MTIKIGRTMSGPIHPNDPRAKYDIASQVARYRKLRYEGNIDVSASEGSRPQRGEITAGLTPYNGPFGREELVFLLKRCLTGVSMTDIRAYEGMTLEGVIDMLFQEKPEPALPVNDYQSILVDPDVPPGNTWVTAPWNLELEGARIISFKSWLVREMTDPKGSLHEKMILFWHNHFVTESWGVFLAKSAYQYFSTLRQNAFGNVRSLTRAITLDPAMLIYLNGTQNSKNAPDENYARELQELFCVGKGPDSGYTEKDVQSASKVLTGWKVDWNSIIGEGPVGVQFYFWDHDTSDKEFSSFYQNRQIAGKTGNAGAEELDELLDMIFSQEETARFICRRLYQFFVYTEIDALTEENVIRPMADQLRADNFEVAPTLRRLLSSEHFFDPENRGAMIKHPLDAVAGLWRGLSMAIPGHFDAGQRMEAWQAMMWQMGVLGMEIGDPPAVAGWPAYHQMPIYDKSWITTNTITNRALTSDSMVYWGFWNPIEPIPADLIEFTSTLDEPQDPNKLIREAELLFLGMPLSDNARADLKSILLSGQQNDSYWTLAWNGLMAAPTNQQLRQLVNFRLQVFYHTLFQFAEFQLI